MDSKKKRVLVTDDDPINRDIEKTVCLDIGLEVFEAANGREALDVLHANPCDVVLLDLRMPELDGFGVLEGLRANLVTPRPAVIIVTAGADAVGRIRGAELGAIDFVEKPFRVPDLARRVRRALAIVDLERRVAEAENALRSLRTTDETTGAGSFQHLHSILEAEFRCAELSQRPLACILIADEGYARCLSYQGRAAGEERLQTLAKILEGLLLPTDYLFRVDAAEFVILRPAFRIDAAQELLAKVEAQVGPEIAAHLVMGAASCPHPQITQASALYRAANVALAQARSHGAGLHTAGGAPG